MNTPTEADKRAADAIYDATWGTREAIWPGVDAVAQLITDHHQPEREALRLAKTSLKDCADAIKDELDANEDGGGDEHPVFTEHRKVMKAALVTIAAIEKVML